MQDLSFQWGNEHRLDLATTNDGIMGCLRLVKGGGNQQIHFAVPPGLTLELIDAAWAEQGGKWDELLHVTEQPFIAIRAIWLPQGHCVLWTVVHVDDVPHDTCGVASMARGRQKGQWRFGHIEAWHRPRCDDNNSLAD